MRQTLTIAPAEIARQLALCDQIRALLDQRPGQKLAYVDTYGCQQNEADSERLRGYLARMGYAFSPTEEGADLVLLNTCAIRGARRAAGVRQRGGPDPHQAPASGAGDLPVRLHGPAGAPCGPAAAPVLSAMWTWCSAPMLLWQFPELLLDRLTRRQAGLRHRGCARRQWPRASRWSGRTGSQGLGVHHVRLQQLLLLLHRPLRPGPGALAGAGGHPGRGP